MGIQISPSILNSDLADLASEVRRIESAADWVHVDVMDNHFVPNLTLGLPVVESLIASVSIPVDCHLMIEDPDRWAPSYAEAGAKSVTFHIEAARNPVALARDLRAAGARAAAAIKPGTSIESVRDIARELDMILIMTVEPGFGGQSFMADMMGKVTEARRIADSSGLDIWVQVDGGIDARTIEIAAEAGANVFVAGSAVYRADEPAEMVTRLRSLAEAAAPQ